MITHTKSIDVTYKLSLNKKVCSKSYKNYSYFEIFILDSTNPLSKP